MLFELSGESMCLLLAFAVSTEYFIGLLAFGGEKFDGDFEIVVRHPDALSGFSAGNWQLFAEVESEESGAAKEKRWPKKF